MIKRLYGRVVHWLLERVGQKHSERFYTGDGNYVERNYYVIKIFNKEHEIEP